MRVKSLKVFVQVLVFGLLLGASSTAYADTVAIASLTVSNLQFNPVTGTADSLRPAYSPVPTPATVSVKV